MIVAVLDTNVLVNGLTVSQGAPNRLLRLAARGAFELVVSDYVLAELRRAFGKRYFAERFDPAQLDRQIRRIQTDARLVELVEPVIGVATHHHDDPVIATALNGGASYLVTGDRELRRIGSFRGITFLTPREFLAVLDVAAAVAEP